jgi:hypothetical protein
MRTAPTLSTRSLSPLLILPLICGSLVACGDKPDDDTGDTGDGGFTPESGYVHACASGPFDNPYESGDDYDSFWEAAVDGVVVSDGPISATLETPLSCYGEAVRVLELTDGAGDTWRFAYGITDGDELDATPAMAVVPGDDVSVHYRAVLDFGSANGFVVTDSSGVVAAVEAGTWGNALRDGDIPGLVVETGSVLGEVDGDCGPAIHRDLTFTGDAVSALAPYTVGSVSVGGASLDAYSVINTTFDDRVQCTDMAGTTSWAAFR